MTALFRLLALLILAIYVAGGVGKWTRDHLEYRLSWYGGWIVYASSILELLLGLGFIRGPAMASAWRGDTAARTVFLVIGVFLFVEGISRFIINKKLGSGTVGSLPVMALTWPLARVLKARERRAEGPSSKR